MATFGYFLSCEEWGPADLVAQARMAERAGFEALWISDHYHPWNDEQGQSPFVWSVIGALAQATSLPVTTAVTCPTSRIHPAVVAQAAATSAEARFATAVAAFGQRLRGGDYIGAFGYDQIAEVARESRGADGEGYRAEFIELVEMAKALDSGS